MLSRSQQAAYVSVVLSAVAVIFTVRTSEFQIRYHEWQMQRSYDSFMAEVVASGDGRPGFIGDGEYAEYEYHRQQLVDLGVVCETTYHFEHILNPSDASRHFSKLLFSSRRPDCIDLSLPSLVEPQPLKLTVWCYFAHKPEWEGLIAARDIRNYEEQFMADNNPDESATTQ